MAAPKKAAARKIEADDKVEQDEAPVAPSVPASLAKGSTFASRAAARNKRVDTNSASLKG